MSTKKVLGLLGMGLLSTALTAGMCTPTESQDCTSEGDCSTEQHCHPTLKVCVDNCKKVTTACDAEPGTTCSETDIITPVNAMSFNGICVCDPASDTCSGGEKCNPTDRVCDTPCTGDSDCTVYPSDQGRTCQDSGGTMFCLPPADSCIGKAADFCGTQVCNTITGSANYGKCIDKCPAAACTSPTICETSSGLCITPCTAGNCGAGKYCDDDRFGNTGACVASPTSCSSEDDCFANDIIGVCDPISAHETYNLCVDADSIATCAAADAFTSGLATGGPMVYELEFAADPDFDTDCDTAVSGSSGYTATFSYYDFEGNAYSTQIANAYNNFKWAEDGGSPTVSTLPLAFSGDATSGIGIMVICFTTAPDEIAIQIIDNANNKSNVACAAR